MRRRFARRAAIGAAVAELPHRGTPREVRRLGTTFNAMASQLQQDAANRQALLADLAHEQRTPLTVIRANVEGIADGVHDASPDRLDVVLDRTTVLARLLDDLSTLSTLEAGALTLHVEEVRLQPIVEAAAAAVSVAKLDVAVTATTDPATPPVEVDPVRMGQVLTNLLTNAVRHTDGTTVTVTLPTSPSDH